MSDSGQGRGPAPSAGAQAGGEGSDPSVFVARQPIFDSSRVVRAYELLYRSGRTRAFDSPDPNQATARVILNAFSNIGIDALTGARPAFINFTRDMLLSDYASVLPPHLAVIEVLENVEPDQEVIKVCRELKRAGYSIALDDFALMEDKYRPLIDLADIVKVDIIGAGEHGTRTLPEQLRHSGVHLLAEKIETEESYRQAIEWGYQYFQGYFFSRPVLIEGRQIPGFKLNYLRILRQAQEPELDYEALEEIVRGDVSMSYKLLRYVNSAAFAWKRRIEHIKQAIVALGEREFRKWVSLLCLAGLGEDKPRELLVQSCVRAAFCERLADLVGLGERRGDLFLTGLFSLLDAIIDRPLQEILETMPVPDDTALALTKGEGRFADVLGSVIAYERGQWDQVATCAERLGLEDSAIAPPYLAAVIFTQEFFEI